MEFWGRGGAEEGISSGTHRKGRNEARTDKDSAKKNNQLMSYEGRSDLTWAFLRKHGYWSGGDWKDVSPRFWEVGRDTPVTTTAGDMLLPNSEALRNRVLGSSEQH